MLTLVVWQEGAWAADVFNGKELYSAYCENCHGADGHSLLAGAPDFSRGEGLTQSDLVLLDHVRNGSAMTPAFQGILNDNEILDVIAYLRTLIR